MLKKLSDQSGFSLVQVMVSVGIMGGLALMMMQMQDNQIKQQKSIEMKAEKSDVANIIRQTLREKIACDSTFIGMKPGDDILEIRLNGDMTQPPFAKVGLKFKTFDVYIKQMYLLTRPEEILYKQRETGQAPIHDYTTGSGHGYLRVTFVKQSGIVSDANTRHDFYGAKETYEYFPIKGYFYEYEIVKHNDEDQLDDTCWSRAPSYGLSCNGSPNQRCSYSKIDEDGVAGTDFIIDLATGTKLYLAECRYYRDDAPFMECASN